MHGKITCPERELYPSAAQPYPAVTRPVQQFFAKHEPDIVKNLRSTGRVKAMASVIDLYSRKPEATGVATDLALPFQDRNLS